MLCIALLCSALLCLALRSDKYKTFSRFPFRVKRGLGRSRQIQPDPTRSSLGPRELVKISTRNSSRIHEPQILRAFRHSKIYRVDLSSGRRHSKIYRVDLSSGPCACMCARQDKPPTHGYNGYIHRYDGHRAQATSHRQRAQATSHGHFTALPVARTRTHAHAHARTCTPTPPSS